MTERTIAMTAGTGGDRAIGIIGGIGPAATVLFMRRVLALTPADTEADHLRLLVDCNPKHPDMNVAALGNGDHAVACLVESGRWLEQAGADMLVVICNAAHCFEERLCCQFGVPLISMIDAACAEAEGGEYSQRGIGVLATDGCMQADLYGRKLRNRGLQQVALQTDDMPVFLDAVRALKIDEQSAEATRMLEYCSGRLVEAGAAAIIVACTEAAIALAEVESRVPYIDPVEALARLVVRLAKSGTVTGNNKQQEGNDSE